MQYRVERNIVVKLIRTKKKKYIEDVIDMYNKKAEFIKMWKTLKEVIRGKPTKVGKTDNVKFEILENDGEGSIADRFNLYYVQSIVLMIWCNL